MGQNNLSFTIKCKFTGDADPHGHNRNISELTGTTIKGAMRQCAIDTKSLKYAEDLFGTSKEGKAHKAKVDIICFERPKSNSFNNQEFTIVFKAIKKNRDYLDEYLKVLRKLQDIGALGKDKKKGKGKFKIKKVIR